MPKTDNRNMQLNSSLGGNFYKEHFIKKPKIRLGNPEIPCLIRNPSCKGSSLDSTMSQIK